MTVIGACALYNWFLTGVINRGIIDLEPGRGHFPNPANIFLQDIFPKINEKNVA